MTSKQEDVMMNKQIAILVLTIIGGYGLSLLLKHWLRGMFDGNNIIQPSNSGRVPAHRPRTTRVLPARIEEVPQDREEVNRLLAQVGKQFKIDLFNGIPLEIRVIAYERHELGEGRVTFTILSGLSKGDSNSISVRTITTVDPIL